MVPHVIHVWRGTRSDLSTGQAELGLAIRSANAELLTDLFVICAVRSVHGDASPEKNGDATILACTVDRREGTGVLGPVQRRD